MFLIASAWLCEWTIVNPKYSFCLILGMTYITPFQILRLARVGSTLFLFLFEKEIDRGREHRSHENSETRRHGTGGAGLGNGPRELKALTA